MLRKKVEIENLAQTWYWVEPASGGVSGERLPTKPFLIGPGQKNKFGPLTFIKNGYLTFHADNSICLQVPGEGLIWPPSSSLRDRCLADEQSRAIVWVMEMEFVWRSVLGTPLPEKLADAILDPVLFGLAETVVRSPEVFRLASDVYGVLNFDDRAPYALAHIPGDILDVLRMEEINGLLKQLGLDPVLRRRIQYLNLVINAGVAIKFAAETLIYPNTGDLTFVAK